MNNQIFTLSQEFNHSEDTGSDGTVVKTMLKSNKNLDFLYSRYEENKDIFPNCIFIQSNFKIILKYDFPLIDPRIFVISKKMKEILNLPIKDILEIPVTLIDDTYFGQLFDENKYLLPDVPINDGFTSIVFKNSIDVMDYEKSVYLQSIMDETKIGSIRKMVIKEPVGGFLPIFKVLNDYTNVYVTEKTKESLEANEIKGCVFEPVEVVPYLCE
jgi:hypothetical protein